MAVKIKWRNRIFPQMAISPRVCGPLFPGYSVPPRTAGQDSPWGLSYVTYLLCVYLLFTICPVSQGQLPHELSLPHHHHWGLGRTSFKIMSRMAGLCICLWASLPQSQGQMDLHGKGCGRRQRTGFATVAGTPLPLTGC